MPRRSLLAFALVLLVAVSAAGAALGTSAQARASSACLWMDTSKTPDQRAKRCSRR